MNLNIVLGQTQGGKKVRIPFNHSPLHICLMQSSVYVLSQSGRLLPLNPNGPALIKRAAAALFLIRCSVTAAGDNMGFLVLQLAGCFGAFVQ